MEKNLSRVESRKNKGKKKGWVFALVASVAVMASAIGAYASTTTTTSMQKTEKVETKIAPKTEATKKEVQAKPQTPKTEIVAEVQTSKEATPEKKDVVVSNVPQAPIQKMETKETKTSVQANQATDEDSGNLFDYKRVQDMRDTYHEGESIDLSVRCVLPVTYKVIIIAPNGEKQEISEGTNGNIVLKVDDIKVGRSEKGYYNATVVAELNGSEMEKAFPPFRVE